MDHQNIFLLTVYGSANFPISSPTLEITQFFYSLPLWKVKNALRFFWLLNRFKRWWVCVCVGGVYRIVKEHSFISNSVKFKFFGICDDQGLIKWRKDTLLNQLRWVLRSGKPATFCFVVLRRRWWASSNITRRKNPIHCKVPEVWVYHLVVVEWGKIVCKQRNIR